MKAARSAAEVDAGRQHAEQPAITLRGVTVTYGDLEALAPTELTVGPREFVSLIGPSGCGKTTLMKVVAGLVAPSGGEVSIFGGSIDEAQRQGAVGLMFQEPNLLPWRRARANATLLSEIMGSRSEDAERTEQLLAETGLTAFADMYPSQLSGGMQQRLALVRTLATDPRLLLMDEPFAALDALTRDRLGDVLLRIWNHSKPVVFVTHSIEEAAYLSDRVVVMSARPGRVLAEIPIDLPRPREHALKDTAEFFEHVRELRRWIDRAQEDLDVDI